MQVKITLKGNKSNNRCPLVKIRINDELLYDSSIENEVTLTFNITAKTNNNLEIEHYNKQNNDTLVDTDGKIVADLSVELKSIEIDNLKILDTVLYSMPFYVKWPDNIIDDYKSRNEIPPDCITNNLYFGFNGIYKFDFLDDAIIEYYRQFWTDEDQAHRNQTIEQKDQEVFNRLGSFVAVNQGNDFTIYDLEKMVLERESDPG